MEDLIIDVKQTEISIALMESPSDGTQQGRRTRQKLQCRRCISRQGQALPALNAAFVDIGDEKDAPPLSRPWVQFQGIRLLYAPDQSKQEFQVILLRCED